MKRTPRVAIVLGQGGLKPAASLPILEMIEEEGIVYDTIVGCSGGSLVGGLKATQTPKEDISGILSYMAKNHYLLHANSKQLMGLMRVPFFKYNKEEGIVHPSLMLQNLDEVFRDKTLEELPIKLVVGCTDFETGHNVVLKKGLVKEALYASSSIYPFMPPMKVDGRLLVDGALSVPIPFETAAQLHPDLIIVMVFNFFPNYSPNGFFSCFDNFFTQAVERKGLELLHEGIKTFPGKTVIVDICLDKPITVMETNGLEEIVNEGRRFAKKYRETILSAYEEVKGRL